MGVTERGRARDLAAKLRGLKAGTRHGLPVPKVRPVLTPEERDLIVRLLDAAGAEQGGDPLGR